VVAPDASVAAVISTTRTMFLPGSVPGRCGADDRRFANIGQRLHHQLRDARLAGGIGVRERLHHELCDARLRAAGYDSACTTRCVTRSSVG